MDAENGELFAAGVAADGWQLDAPFSCSDLVFSGSAKPLQDWAVDPDCTLNDSESEDVLHGVDPNEVFPSGLPADCSSESDSGISEDPVAESPFAAVTSATPQPATVYQVVYDISGLGGVKTEPGLENVISIELDAWSSQMLFPDSCVVNELPVAPAARLDGCPTANDPLGHDVHLPPARPVSIMNASLRRRQPPSAAQPPAAAHRRQPTRPGPMPPMPVVRDARSRASRTRRSAKLRRSWDSSVE
ncbi:cyclic AMP-responsive element-binding protein 3-like protein 4 [Perca flavescens]|uniref:cyclic AMP-responsive element-binding protein 3-like protein 4 n=1 Tax=Perca flavescens TaxID=8167 RepID=UPI00106EFCF3|nr:cyclic AMP-responsive element-binding protein 3-like protein 4 [Perca flavescens]